MSNKFFDILEKYCLKRGMNLDEDKINQDLKVTNEQQSVEIKKSHDFENKIAVEIVAEPYTPDAHGHWYSKETVEKGYQSFDKAWKEGRLNMNLFHSYDDVSKNNVELIKHYVVPFDCEVNGQKVKEGTWVAEVKYHNEELFKMRTIPDENGEYAIAGLSLKGWGKINDPKKKGE